MTYKSIHHFLLTYDRAAGQLIETLDFNTDSDAAVAAYAAKELEYQNQKSIEVVLLGSDSIETVKITHPNYFGGTIPESKYFIGI
jgi:hypothetical protein